MAFVIFNKSRKRKVFLRYFEFISVFFFFFSVSVYEFVLSKVNGESFYLFFFFISSFAVDLQANLFYVYHIFHKTHNV